MKQNPEDLEAIIAASWPECVGTLMGADHGDPARRERQRVDALRLAAAALDFAGETVLANEVRERIEDAA
ncbi:hypothetical protein [Bradyrhizobium sp. AUGA SZCCT0160]|uniref:hypothetical protein n=1 Tax=Bradyrhizobium sp. AUGA SZCCT0160 TaxID=2807662 RepID=UPI001BAB8E61|nr:hypothetical protein [Bradyrhizobium sp. AUGA SZCCT0160]MBR1193969.1 hypothetical protein [Bradyrhizobium sp. AUGA SZCCT0160]